MIGLPHELEYCPCPERAAEVMESDNNNNNRRLVTLAEHTSDHGRQTNSSTEEKGESDKGEKIQYTSVCV